MRILLINQLEYTMICIFAPVHWLLEHARTLGFGPTLLRWRLNLWGFSATFAFCIKALGLATFFIVPENANRSYQRRPSSPRKREGNVRFPTNLNGVRRSARPTSRWAPKAHRMIMMGKTQWRHCERSFGTNVLVLGKERDNFPLLSEPLKTDVNKNVVIERFLN